MCLPVPLPPKITCKQISLLKKWLKQKLSSSGLRQRHYHCFSIDWLKCLLKYRGWKRREKRELALDGHPSLVGRATVLLLCFILGYVARFRCLSCASPSLACLCTVCGSSNSMIGIYFCRNLVADFIKRAHSRLRTFWWWTRCGFRHQCPREQIRTIWPSLGGGARSHLISNSSTHL